MVDEHAALVAQPDKARPRVLQISAQRPHALRCRSARSAPWRPCRARRACRPRGRDRRAQADRLRRAQPARVHRLQQRPVAQRAPARAARLREQQVDLVAAESTLGRRPRGARRAQLRSGVGHRGSARGAGSGRTSAGTRSCAAASREPPPAARRAAGQLADERREVAGAGVQRIDARAGRGTRRIAADQTGRPRSVLRERPRSSSR